MPSRYYFLSSLPMLRFSDCAPISWEEFMASAEGNISNADYKLLSGIPEGKTGGNRFLKEWDKFNKGLKAAVNSLRRENLGKVSPGETKTFFDYDLEQYSSAAVSARNPLEAEMILMQCKYDYLEKKIMFDAFSQTGLLVYALELQILLRKDMFTKESGNSEYQKLFGILQKEMKMD